jgi:uncharacterized protein (TIGR02147 family)
MNSMVRPPAVGAQPHFDFWTAQSYVELLRFGMGVLAEAKRSGVIKEVAEALKVHSTYLSQILSGKSHLSQEQGLRFCAWARWSAAETDFFLLLLSRDRAGSKDLFDYFQSKISHILERRLQVRSRIPETRVLSPEQKSKYYESWVHQAVHFLLLIPKIKSKKQIAASLLLPQETVQQSLKLLMELGLVERTESGFESRVPFLHLDKDSPEYARSMASFRIKAIEDFSKQVDPAGMFYTSVCTMDSKTAERVKVAVLQILEESREWIREAPSEQLHALHVDFYRMDLSE